MDVEELPLCHIEDLARGCEAEDKAIHATGMVASQNYAALTGNVFHALYFQGAEQWAQGGQRHITEFP